MENPIPENFYIQHWQYEDTWTGGGQRGEKGGM